MRMLVSVRDLAEARLAVAGGAGFVDLKEPRAGALGGLPVATVRAVVRGLREAGCALPISATIGDRTMDEVEGIVRDVESTGACGVDYVKVGIASGGREVLRGLAASGRAVVPVFLADRGIDFALVAQAADLGFPALMVDTADKAAGSLFDVVSAAALRDFIGMARSRGAMAGLAGSLRGSDVPSIRDLAPDFAGFRGAVCAAGRTGALDPARLAALARRMSHPGSA